MSTRLEKRDVSESLAGIGVACLVSVVTLALSGMMRSCFERWSIAAGAAIATSVVLAIVAWKGPPRLAASAGLGTLGALGGVVLVGCAWCLAQPLVATHARCGTADIGVPFFLAIVGFVGAALALPLALVGRLVPRASLVAAVVITLAGAVVAALGVRSLAEPEPDAYLKLFAQTAIEPGATAVVDGKTVVYDGAPKPSSPYGDRKCTLVVGDDHVAVEAFDICPSLVLASDPVANHLLVMTKPFDEPVAIVGAVAGYAPDMLGVGDFPGRLGAPRAWVYGALGGLAIALVSLGLAFRARRRARRVDAAVETTHTGSGWVSLDGAPRFVSDLATRAPGPVVVVASEATRSPTYRDDGAAKIFKVIPGNRATLRAEAQMHAAAWAYVAIASVVTTSVPLWMSRVFGIL